MSGSTNNHSDLQGTLHVIVIPGGGFAICAQGGGCKHPGTLLRRVKIVGLSGEFPQGVTHGLYRWIYSWMDMD